MPARAPNVSHIFVDIDGSELAPEIRSHIVEVVVDQNAHLPDMFTVTLQDKFDRRSEKFKIIDDTQFDIGKTVKIESSTYSDRQAAGSGSVTLIEGEITSIEPIFSEAMVAQLVIRGYDKSHRGFHEIKSNTFINHKDSDIASAIAGNAGLGKDIETTSTVYDHVFQNNQSDLSFLLQRAWRIGFECYVEGGKLHFKKPPDSGSELELTYGTNLMQFSPRMSVAKQVSEVLVKGWDPKAKKSIVGSATSGKLYPSIGISSNGASYASKFGTAKEILVDHPVVSQAEANAIAQARLNELSGSFIEAEGRAIRSPNIRAGKIVELKNLGSRFSGKYLVTIATHRWSGTGIFETDFIVSGTSSGTMLDRLTDQDPVNRWTGVVTALVTNTDDPDKLGRVKLKYPWLDESQESWWARVACPGGGPEAGLVTTPDVNDEVLVAFEQGDFNRPYVLGGLWNSSDKPPGHATGASSGEVPLVRSWRSRSGHYISMYDDSNEKLEIATAKGLTITLDDAGKMLTIKTNGGMTFTVDDNSSEIKIKGGGDIIIEATKNMKLKAGMDFNIEATKNLSMKGLQTTLEGTTKATVKGLTVGVEGSTMAEVKGAIVKIN